MAVYVNATGQIVDDSEMDPREASRVRMQALLSSPGMGFGTGMAGIGTPKTPTINPFSLTPSEDVGNTPGNYWSDLIQSVYRGSKAPNWRGYTSTPWHLAASGANISPGAEPFDNGSLLNDELSIISGKEVNDAFRAKMGLLQQILSRGA